MSTAMRALRELRHAVQPVPADQPSRGRLRAVPEAPAARRDRLVRLFTALAGLGVCFGLFAVVGVHVMLAQGQAGVQRLQEQVTREQERHRRLELQVAELEAPAHVVAAARERLGLVPPTTVVALPPASLDDPPPTTLAPAPATPAPPAPPSR